MFRERYIILLSCAFIFMVSCQSPSEPSGSIISKKYIYDIDTYCYDVDVNDTHIVLAASNGGYYKFSYQLDSDSFPELTLISSTVDHNPDYQNDSIDRVILSEGNEGMIYMLDRYSGGSSGVWFDNTGGVSMEPASYPISEYCYQGKFLDIALDESEPDNFFGFDKHVVYTLMKHTSLNENSDDDEFAQYSTSIIKREIDIVPLLDGEALEGLEPALDDCNFLYNLNYDTNEIHFGDNRLVAASESDGVIVFDKNDGGTLDSLFSFNLSGGQAQTAYSLDNAVIGGFSNDKGCYMALLESNTNNVSNYVSFADGYSVKGIDYHDGLIGLATGSDGIQIYQWLGGSTVTPYGSYDTGYAYDLKIKDDLVFVATREGLEILKIGR